MRRGACGYGFGLTSGCSPFEPCYCVCVTMDWFRKGGFGSPFLLLSSRCPGWNSAQELTAR